MKDPKKEIAEELNELAPFLAKLKKEKKQEQHLPAEYFNNFEDRLRSRIREEEALTPKIRATQQKDNSFWSKISWLFRPQYTMGLATVAILVVVGLNLFNQPTETLVKQTPEQLFAQLTTEDLTIYINNNIEDFSTEDIIQTMDEQTLKEFPSSEKVFRDAKADIPPQSSNSSTKLSIDDLTEEEILEALDDEDLDELEDIF